MGKPSNPLYKTCSSCGLQKPLSAFLQLSGTKGTTYGNVCASCRKSESEGESKSHKEEEGTRRQVGGSRIGAQERVAAETEKEKIRRDIDERYHENRDEAAVEQSEVAEKKQALAQTEKKRREKSTFLNANRSYSEANNNAKQTTWQEILSEEVREQQPDFTKDAPTDTAIAGKSKYVQSSIFQQFMSWLNKGSAMARASDQAKVRRGQIQPLPKTITTPATQPKTDKQTVTTQTRVMTDTKTTVKTTPAATKETKTPQTQQAPAQTTTPRTETKAQPVTQSQNASVRRAAEWNSRLTTKSLFNTQEKTAEKMEPAKEKPAEFVKKNFTPRTR